MHYVFGDYLRIGKNPTLAGWWGQRRVHVLLLSGLVIFDAIITYLAIFVWQIGTELNPLAVWFMGFAGGIGFVINKVFVSFLAPFISYAIYSKYAEGGKKWELIFEKWFFVGFIIIYGIVAANNVYQLMTSI